MLGRPGRSRYHALMTARVLPFLVVLAAVAPVPAHAQSELVIVKQGTSEYHRPGCAVVSDGVDVLAMTRAQAEGRKLTAHEACDPAKAAAAGPDASGTAAAKPVFVYVDASAKHYHLEKCERLGKGRKKIALAEAGLKHWPCTVCKPPIRKRPRK